MKPRLHWLQVVVHIGSWLPLAWLTWAYLAQRLSINPIQEALQRTGKVALVLLVLSLACTPINTLLGWPAAVRVRRALGLYAFLYALIHLSILIGLDYQLNFRFLYQDLSGKAYIWVGAAAWLILLALAVTSFQWTMKRLGKNWKRLHRLVYLASVLVILHYAWAKKGDLFSLQGDIGQPVLFGVLVGVLLVLRIPPIRRGIKTLRSKLSMRLNRSVFSPLKTRRRA